MPEFVYTITGNIDPNTAHQLIVWVVGQIINTPKAKLKILISSIGGDIDSAIRIYFFLKGIEWEVETIAFSQIDSAANTIFVAGKNRIALKGTRFFLHEGSYTLNSSTNIDTHIENITILKELLSRSVAILSVETGKSTDEIRKALKTSLMLDDQSAKNFGLVHEIVEELPLSSLSQNKVN